MKKILSFMLAILAVFGFSNVVNAESLTSSMVKDLSVQIEDVEEDSISFTLLNEIKLDSEKSRINYSISIYNKTTNELEWKYEEPVEKSELSIEGTSVSGTGGGFYEGKSFADYNYVAIVTVINENGIGEIITFDMNNQQITKIEKVGESKEEEKTPTEETKPVETKKEDKNISMPEGNKINKDSLEEAKSNGTKLTIESKKDDKVMYAWIFDGSKMESSNFDLDLTLTLNSSENKEKIESLVANKDSSLVLHFTHHGDLPDGTKVRIYVGDKYSNNKKLNLYYYNETTQKLEEVNKDLEVIDGYVTVSLEHCSDYVLEEVASSVPEKTPNTSNNAQTSNMDVIFYSGLALISLIGIAFLVITRKKKEIA